MSNVFTAKVGARFVDAAEVVTWIAQRIHPIDNRPPQLASLEKKTSQTDENGFDEWRVESLADADWVFLRQAWSQLGDALQATGSEWPRYAQAFSQAKKAAGAAAPAWELHPTFRHVREQSISEQREVRKAYVAQMEEEFARGHLQGWMADRTPATVVQLGVMLSVDDARRYLEGLGYGFHIAATESEHARATSGAGDWKAHVPPAARAIMERYMSRYRRGR